MFLVKALGHTSTIAFRISMVAILLIMVLVTVDVIARNILGVSISGSSEIAEFLQGAAVFLGIAATLRSGHHISADLLVEALPLRYRAAIDIVTNLISLVVFSLMTYALWSMAMGPGSGQEISELLGIPERPFRMIAAFGVALLCLEILGIIFRSVCVLAGHER